MRKVLFVLCVFTILLGGFSQANAELGDYESIFVSAGKDYGLNPNLLKALAYRESGIRNAPCNGYPKGSVGYCGVMQISGERFGNRALNPEFNIREGTRHFKSCMSSRKNNVIEALVCYNAGLGRNQEIDRGELRFHVVTRIMPDFGKQIGKTPAWTPCKVVPGSFNDVCGYVHYVIDRYGWYEGRTPYSDKVDKNVLAKPEPYVDAFLLGPGTEAQSNKTVDSSAGGFWFFGFAMALTLVIAGIKRRRNTSRTYYGRRQSRNRRF